MGYFELSVPPIWIYTPSDAQLRPHYLVYSKMYVDMENLFIFWFCLCDLFVKNEDAPSYARPFHRKSVLALGQFSTRAILSLTMTELWLLVNSLDCLCFCQTRSTTFCLFPVIVCERIARVENCPGARASFQ